MPLPVPGLGVTFLAPWALAAGAGVAGGLVALHLVTTGRPRPAWLPTARFAPDRPPRAARRLRRRPTDRALLATRVAAALCAAAALARPVPTPERRPTARVVLADRSDAAAPGAVRAAAGAVAGPGDVLVAFAARPAAPLRLAADSAARARQLDSALGNALGTTLSAAAAAGRGAAAAPGAPASLTAALVAARRAAPALAAGADSVELVLVGPLAAEQADAATAAVRAAWAGRARVVRVAAASPASWSSPGSTPSAAPASPGSDGLRGVGAGRRVWLRDAPADDALAAALALAGVPAGGADAPVRVARGRVAPADRAWAREAGRVLVVWPADGVPDATASAPTAANGLPSAADTAYALVALAGPPPSIARARRRSAAGVGGTADGVDDAADSPATAPAVAVAPFVRRALPDTAPGDGAAPRVVLRWADGRPAAVERAAGGGCVRTVAVAVPQAGDAALRAGFRALLPALLTPCGPPRDLAPLPAADVARLAGAGPLLAAAPLRARLAPPSPDPVGAGLLGAALLALAAEWPLRRAGRRAGTAADGAGAEGDDARAAGPSGAVDASEAASAGAARRAAA